MNFEELKSLLCKDAWSYDPAESHIRFESDGKGKIFACSGFCTFFSSELEWSIVTDDEKSEADIEPAPDTNAEIKPPETQLEGHFRLHIRLTGQVPPASLKNESSRSGLWTVNQRYLKEQAFQPKIFEVTLESGRFAAPSEVFFAVKSGEESGGCDIEDKPWTRRLIFHESPYPPECEWTDDFVESGVDPDSYDYWECKDFVSHGQWSTVPSTFLVKGVDRPR